MNTIATESRNGELERQINEFLANVLQQTRVPGIAVGISIDGQRIHACHGVQRADSDLPVSESTEFHLGCITRFFVAIIVLELVREGKLDLQTPIGEYLSELEDTVHGKSVTIAHLLSHTSGYKGTAFFRPETYLMLWANLVDYLRSAPQYFVPGTIFNEENTESVIVAQIVARVTNKSVFEHFDEFLFSRLGLSVGRFSAESSSSRQAGCHILSPREGRFRLMDWSTVLGPAPNGRKGIFEMALSRYTIGLPEILTVAEFIMGQGAIDGKVRPLSGATLKLLRSPVIALPKMISSAISEVAPESYGIGAGHWRDGFSGVGGSTFGQSQGFRFDSRRGIAVAVAINAYMPVLRDLVIGRICEQFPDGNSGRKQTEGEHYEMSEIAGEYEGAGSKRASIQRQEGRCVVFVDPGFGTRRGRVEIEMGAGGKLSLATKVPNLQIGFAREQDGGSVVLMMGPHAFKKVRSVDAH
jgi:CubicO group peptidase (beta-lactamase class C family)